MQNNDDGNFKLITQLLEKLYELNRRGYYTVWFDWSGHTNGIYIKIIKGKWRKDKKEKVVYEALVCTRFKEWKNGLSEEPFDMEALFTLVQILTEDSIFTNTKPKKIPA